MTRSPELAALARASRQRIPDFFIVGHHKCGTTALYEVLRRHPQIFMPDLKEPRFFATDERGKHSGSKYPRTLEEYLALFEPATADQRAGEASPQYLRSHTAARLIAEVQPAARIIAILREPASFLRSLHLQLVQDHVETESDLGKAFATEDLRFKGLMDRSATEHVLRYSDHVRYVEQLRRYHAIFPSERVLVLIYDDFRRDNESTIRQVLRFLDVDDEAPIELLDANPTVHVRSIRVDRAIHWLTEGRAPVSRALKMSIKTLIPRRMQDELQAIRRRIVYGGSQQADEQVMVDMRRRFKPEIVALSEYLSRDLVTMWGYDDV
jgi:hypothetical protein